MCIPRRRRSVTVKSHRGPSLSSRRQSGAARASRARDCGVRVGGQARGTRLLRVAEVGVVRLQGEGGPIGFPSPWSRTTPTSAIRKRRAPRAWTPARTPQSRARLARAPVPHCGETITVAFLGFHNHAPPSEEPAPTFKAAARRDASARCPNPHEGPDN